VWHGHGHGTRGTHASVVVTAAAWAVIISAFQFDQSFKSSARGVAVAWRGVGTVARQGKAMQGGPGVCCCGGGCGVVHVVRVGK